MPGAAHARRPPARPASDACSAALAQDRRDAALLSALPAVVSYLLMAPQPSDTSLSIRSVEWLRDNGAAGAGQPGRVDLLLAQRAVHRRPGTARPAPPGSGRRLAAAAARSRVAVAPAYRPPRIATGHHARAARRGRLAARPSRAAAVDRRCWSPAFVLTRTTRRWSPGSRGSISTETSTQLYPGRAEPAVSMPSRGPMEVPASTRSRLGRDLQQRASSSAIRGAASRATGTPTPPCAMGWRRSFATATAAWTSSPGHGGPSAGPDVVYARQNLPLIVAAAAERQPQRRTGMGRHARQRRSRVAVWGRGRRPRQPHLRRRQ